MLHIFLVILKIIGILLAAILGILVFLVICILFWPVHYCVTGGHKDRWMVKARIHFLGPVFWFTVRYEEEVNYRLRIMGIPILFSRRDKKAKKADKVKKTYEEEDKLYIEKMEESRNQLDEGRNKTVIQKKQKQASAQENSSKKEWFLIRLWNRIRETIHRWLQTMRSFYRHLSKWKEIFEDEGVRRGMTRLKSEIFLLLRKLKPKKLRWYLKIGMEDPANTGQLLGVLAVIKSFWDMQIQVEPDFEHQVFETDFLIKGSIQGFRFVRLAWNGFFDKEIKYLWKRVRMKEES